MARRLKSVACLILFRRLCSETIAPRLFDYVMAIGRKHGFVVDRIGLLPDHLHLIIEAIPSVSVYECALAILNNTHQWMARHYWGVLKATGAWEVWQPSFYAGRWHHVGALRALRYGGVGSLEPHGHVGLSCVNPEALPHAERRAL